MYKDSEKLTEIKLAGIKVRTSNVREMNPDTAKIGETMQKFFGNNMREKIINRKNPAKLFSVYTEYESNEHGEYTYFIGEEVTNFENIPETFEGIIIPEQNYTKFTSDPGPMPDVCIDMWQNIWKMDEFDLGGKRAYIADFEIYDERSKGPNHTVLDIYIGIKG